MSRSTTKRRPQRRSVQHPQPKAAPRRLRAFWPLGLLVVFVIVLLVAFALSSGADEQATASGLPDTPDYHSLLVAPDDPETIVLGTHEGLFRSTDGGVTWAKAALAGKDAMNLARSGGDVVWAAGHGVLAKSTDGGETWQEQSPPGLPHLDVHGFAVDPREAKRLYAAIANEGLYRSTDGGESFELLTREVGPGVMALAVTPTGRILAGEMQRGLFVSDDGGKRWTRTLEIGAMGLAVNPAQPERIVATGSGIYLSEDGGRDWTPVWSIPEGAGPVAWSPSSPNVGYVVGFNKTLYTTVDGGRLWEPVTGAED